MIGIPEQINHETTCSGANAPLWLEATGRSQVARVEHAATGTRVTLEFRHSLRLPPGQAVRLRYDVAGDGRLQECTGIAQLTHTVMRRGHLVVFHYRLSHWIRKIRACG